MKIFKKKIEVTIPEVKETVETKAIKAKDAAITLTEEEITSLKDLIPLLNDTLPKIVAFLSGEAEVEIIEDDEVADEVEEAKEDDVSIDDLKADEITEDELVEGDSEGDSEGEEPKAEDAESKVSTAKVEGEPKAEDKTFDVNKLLEDPEKRAAIEAALGKKATDVVPESKAKKVFVKKTLPKKAGDGKVVPANPNAELLQTEEPKKSLDSKEPEIRKFDFHRRGR